MKAADDGSRGLITFRRPASKGLFRLFIPLDVKFFTTHDTRIDAGVHKTYPISFLLRGVVNVLSKICDDFAPSACINLFKFYYVTPKKGLLKIQWKDEARSCRVNLSQRPDFGTTAKSTD